MRREGVRYRRWRARRTWGPRPWDPCPSGPNPRPGTWGRGWGPGQPQSHAGHHPLPPYWASIPPERKLSNWTQTWSPLPFGSWSPPGPRKPSSRTGCQQPIRRYSTPPIWRKRKSKAPFTIYRPTASCLPGRLLSTARTRGGRGAWTPCTGSVTTGPGVSTELRSPPAQARVQRGEATSSEIRNAGSRCAQPGQGRSMVPRNACEGHGGLGTRPSSAAETPATRASYSHIKLD